MEIITEIGMKITGVVSSLAGNKCLPEIVEIVVVEKGWEDREMVAETAS
jgi:hypothetical protein